MGYCEKCKIKVIGKLEQCPLCGGCPSGEICDETEIFPDAAPEKRKHSLLIKILVLCSVIAAAVCFAVNASIAGQNWWLNYVLAGLASFWALVFVALKKCVNPAKAVLYFSVTASVLIFLWDIATGFHRWSLDFVLPVLLVCAICATVMFARYLCLKPQDYLFYLVLNILLGMIPMVLFLFGVPRVICPSAVCAAVSIIALGVLVIFRGDILEEELDRRLHF